MGIESVAILPPISSFKQISDFIHISIPSPSDPCARHRLSSGKMPYFLWVNPSPLPVIGHVTQLRPVRCWERFSGEFMRQLCLNLMGKISEEILSSDLGVILSVSYCHKNMHGKIPYNLSTRD